MHIDPVLGRELLVGDRHADAFAEDLGAAAGKRVEAGFAQRDQHVLDRHLVDARDVRDLDSRQRLDVNVRVARLEAAEHLAVVLEPGLHIESTDDMELLRQSIGRRLRFGVYLVERVVICAFFLRQPRKGAEDAGLTQVADVGRIDVLVGRERHDVAVLAAIGVVGKHPHSEEVGRCEEKLRVGVREALVRSHLFSHGSERAIGDLREVERDLRRAGHRLSASSV